MASVAYSMIARRRPIAAMPRIPAISPGHVSSRQISAGNSGVRNGFSDQVSSSRPWRVERKLKNHCPVLAHCPAPRHSGCCAPRT